eukprot:GHVQ01011836.1.p1 GENE.GHVQ01011836.1~~GHVQ01011836.1.p1  ORF type:complete len:289 (+),score=58.05 GHVQ01011836.1:225-1091(+)
MGDMTCDADDELKQTSFSRQTSFSSQHGPGGGRHAVCGGAVHPMNDETENSVSRNTWDEGNTVDPIIRTRDERYGKNICAMNKNKQSIYKESAASSSDSLLAQMLGSKTDKDLNDYRQTCTTASIHFDSQALHRSAYWASTSRAVANLIHGVSYIIHPKYNDTCDVNGQNTGGGRGGLRRSYSVQLVCCGDSTNSRAHDETITHRLTGERTRGLNAASSGHGADIGIVRRSASWSQSATALIDDDAAAAVMQMRAAAGAKNKRQRETVGTGHAELIVQQMRKVTKYLR